MPSYTVAKGDTLSGIAQKVGLGNNWQGLGYTGDPTKLQVGTTLSWGDNSGSSSSSAQPSSSSSSSASASTPSTTDPLQQYIDEATNMFSSGNTELNNAVMNEAQTTQTMYNTMAQQQISQESLVRQTYSNLADELTQTYNTQMTAAQQTGQQNIGSAEASLASSGVDVNAQGAFRAPITAAQNSQQTQINSISNQYSVNQDKVTADLNSSIEQLNNQAQQYQLQGNQSYATALTQLASLKQQQQQQILSYAQSAYSAATQAQQNAFLDNIKIMQVQQKDEQLQIMNQNSQANQERANAETVSANARSQYYASEESTKYKAKPNSAGTGMNYSDPNGNPISIGQFAASTGQSISELLSTSPSPKDQQAADVINGWVNSGMSPTQVQNNIAQKYPWMVEGM